MSLFKKSDQLRNRRREESSWEVYVCETRRLTFSFIRLSQVSSLSASCLFATEALQRSFPVSLFITSSRARSGSSRILKVDSATLTVSNSRQGIAIVVCSIAIFFNRQIFAIKNSDYVKIMSELFQSRKWKRDRNHESTGPSITRKPKAPKNQCDSKPSLAIDG